MLTKELILQTSTLLMLFSLPLPGDKLHAPKVKSWIATAHICLLSCKKKSISKVNNYVYIVLRNYAVPKCYLSTNSLNLSLVDIFLSPMLFDVSRQNSDQYIKSVLSKSQYSYALNIGGAIAL